jgi:hypothetical protein
MKRLQGGVNVRRGWLIGVLAAISIAAALALGSIAFVASSNAPNSPKSPKMSAAAFQDGMRVLWEDHVTWTRLTIVSVIEDLPDAGATVQRLLRNQADIGNAIKPFYGDAAGDQLTALLTDHILIAAEILNAAKAGDGPAVEAATARWYVNADDIASFLASANPDHWDLPMMKGMMRGHLDLTLAEAVAQLSGDYERSVALYDEVHGQILHMADMLSEGIIAQFPSEFNGPFPN